MSATLLDNPKYMTDRSMLRGERQLELAEELIADSHREHRQRISECRACYYLERGRIVGHGFTRYVCALCGEKHYHGNTGVPKASAECAKKTGQCARCLGAAEWPDDWPRRHVQITPNRGTDMAPDWTRQAIPERFDACRQFLAMYGLLTNADSARVFHRIEKMVARIARARAKKAATEPHP